MGIEQLTWQLDISRFNCFVIAKKKVIPLLFEKGALKVRYLQEQDRHLLLKWLSNPAVLELYEGRDNSFNYKKVKDKFFNHNDELEMCIFEYNKEPIGFIQFYEINERTSSLDEHDFDEIVYGMDQFIGKTEFWNKGIGTLLVNVTAQYLVNHRKADNIIMDPQITNTRAIKCYEKAGFTKVKRLPKHEIHEGAYRDCWLMEYRNISD